MSEDYTGDELASIVAKSTAELMMDKRDTHGDAVENQEHIAEAWTWYLRGQGYLDEDEAILGDDASRMMVLLKISRVCVGEYDLDHDKDAGGYSDIAAACKAKQDEEVLEEIVNSKSEQSSECGDVRLSIDFSSCGVSPVKAKCNKDKGHDGDHSNGEYTWNYE